MKFTTLLATALLLVPGSQLVRANLIQNGGFENPGQSANSITSGVVVPGWSNTLTIFNGSQATPPHWPTAYEGSQFADIGNASGSVYSQAFTVGAAGNYLLSWADNTGYYNLGDNASSPYRVVVLSGLSSIYDHTFDAFHPGSWQLHSQSLFLSAGAYSLSFAPQGVYGGYDTLIDAVSLVDSSVPDHTSSAVALAGALVLMAVAGKSRRN